MPVQEYDLFPMIQKFKKHLFSQDMAEYIFGIPHKLLVIIITGLQFCHYYDEINEEYY